jgi:hypothetical protein
MRKREHGKKSRIGVLETPSTFPEREAKRYRIAAPASFNWVAADGTSGEGEGCSRDISEWGAFVFARRPPPVGANLCVIVSLRNAVMNKRWVRLEINGAVVRAEVYWKRGLLCGFAVNGKTRVVPWSQKVADPSPLIH